MLSCSLLIHSAPEGTLSLETVAWVSLPTMPNIHSKDGARTAWRAWQLGHDTTLQSESQHQYVLVDPSH